MTRIRHTRRYKLIVRRSSGDVKLNNTFPSRSYKADPLRGNLRAWGTYVNATNVSRETWTRKKIPAQNQIISVLPLIRWKFQRGKLWWRSKANFDSDRSTRLASLRGTSSVHTRQTCWKLVQREVGTALNGGRGATMAVARRQRWSYMAPFQSFPLFLPFCGVRAGRERKGWKEEEARWTARRDALHVRREGEYQLHRCLPLEFSGNSPSKLSPGTLELPAGRTMPGGRLLLHLHTNWGVPGSRRSPPRRPLAASPSSPSPGKPARPRPTKLPLYCHQLVNARPLDSSNYPNVAATDTLLDALPPSL